MKKLSKILMLIFMIGLFSVVDINSVMADGGGGKFKATMNDRLTAILTGTGKDPFGKDDEPILNGVFNGNYVLACKYKYSKAYNGQYNVRDYNSTFNIYYSLKEGNRKFVIIRISEGREDKDSSLMTKINSVQLGTSKSLIGGSKGKSNESTDIYLAKRGTYVFPDTDPLFDLVANGKCPESFTVTLFKKSALFGQSTKIQNCLGNSCPLITSDEKDAEKTTLTYDRSRNYIADGLEKAYNDTKSEFNIDNFRTQIGVGNQNTLGGQIYQYEWNKMMQNGNCQIGTQKDDGNINNYYKRAISLYKDNVKRNVITTRNGSDVTKLSLPKLITNCDSSNNCLISNNNRETLYQRYYNHIVGLVAQTQDTAHIDCLQKRKDENQQLNEQLAECWANNLGNESVCNELENQVKTENDAYRDFANEEKEKNSESIDLIYSQFKIVPEQEKPKGCAIFGENITKYLKWAYTIIKIGAPLLVVIFGILDFANSLLSGEDKGFKESWQKFIKRLIAAVVVVILPVFITFLLNISGVLKQYGIDTKSNDIYCIFK